VISSENNKDDSSNQPPMNEDIEYLEVMVKEIPPENYDMMMPKSAAKETLDLGSPIINMGCTEIEDNIGSLLNKNSIIEHQGSEILGKVEYDS
jgi:hypothetical protein